MVRNRLAILLVAVGTAALGGCAVYATPDGDIVGPAPVVVGPPAIVVSPWGYGPGYGYGAYGYGGYGYGYGYGPRYGYGGPRYFSPGPRFAPGRGLTPRFPRP